MTLRSGAQSSLPKDPHLAPCLRVKPVDESERRGKGISGEGPRVGEDLRPQAKTTLAPRKRRSPPTLYSQTYSHTLLGFD